MQVKRLVQVGGRWVERYITVEGAKARPVARGVKLSEHPYSGRKYAAGNAS